MRVSQQPAYILHSRPYRDSSLLLDVFTAEQGRLSLVAKGARRRARGGSDAALLQPFSPLLISFSGRTELKNLTQVEVAGPPAALRGERMFSGLYINELLARLLHRHDPHPTLFAAYAEALRDIEQVTPMDGVLRRFELCLLDDLGYRIDLSADSRTGESLREDAWYHYDAEIGLVERHEVSDAARPAYAGSDLMQISRGNFSGAARLTAKRLMRQVLAAHLGDVPLRSRELFRGQGGDPGDKR